MDKQIGRRASFGARVNFKAGAALTLLLAMLSGGCEEQLFSYQAREDSAAASRKVLVLPFMDTRTFIDNKDPHRDDLGEHARDIFISTLRNNPIGSEVEILSPALPSQTDSLTSAQAAEIGRRHGADLVVAGQVFSFTETRAASIPARAGMFVRVVSASDGALLFVGDNYQAASIPGAGGGRELQAKNVAAKLVNGFFKPHGDKILSQRGVASNRALARLIAFPAENDNASVNLDDLPPPEPPPFLSIDEEEAAANESAGKIAAVQEEETPDAANPVIADAAALDKRPEAAEDGMAAAIDKPRDDIEELAAKISGDDLAADIFAEGDELLAGALAFHHEEAESQAAAGRESSVLSETSGPAAGSADFAAAPAMPSTEEAAQAVPSLPDQEAVDLAEMPLDDGPVVSIPLAAEQPRLYLDNAKAIRSDRPRGSSENGDHPIRVLLLPYHDRENPNNLIAATGGGEVVTSIFGARLAGVDGMRLLWDATGQTTHERLLTRDEAVKMGRIAGADYVVRGQVVEFRRSQSVPSIYSAVISTALLAAQIVFAEMSGVDVATEVYRVSDGRCVTSRRDRTQQKYVVQAEKNVRRLSVGLADSLLEILTQEDPETMDPIIDTLSPVTVMTNPS